MCTGHSIALTHNLYVPLCQQKWLSSWTICWEHQKTKVSSSTLFYPVCPSIVDVQQLRAILSVAGVDLARDERESPAARPRLLDQLLRLLRQARPEEVLSLDTRIDG